MAEISTLERHVRSLIVQCGYVGDRMHKLPTGLRRLAAGCDACILVRNYFISRAPCSIQAGLGSTPYMYDYFSRHWGAVLARFLEFAALALHVDIGKEMVPIVVPQMMSHKVLQRWKTVKQDVQVYCQGGWG